MLRLRMIQVGLGGWGQDWARNVLLPSQDVEVVACVDPAPAGLERAREIYSLPPERCFASLEDALDTVPCDVVLITAAIGGHVPNALMALAAGKHVLCEKPFAPSLTEAQQVVKAAEQAGRVLMVSQNYRFFPAARAAAQVVQSGMLGQIGMVNVDFRRSSNRRPREGHRHYTLLHPLLLDMAIHHFDLMRMLIDQEPASVECYAFNPPWSKFEYPAAAVMTVRFDGGAVLSYRGSWVSPGPQTPWAGLWRMEGSEGELSWTGRGVKLSDDKATFSPFYRQARRLPLPELPGVDRAGSLHAFANAVRDGEEPECSGRDNLGTLALAYAAIESAATGKPQPVPRDLATRVIEP